MWVIRSTRLDLGVEWTLQVQISSRLYLSVNPSHAIKHCSWCKLGFTITEENGCLGMFLCWPITQLSTWSVFHLVLALWTIPLVWVALLKVKASTSRVIGTHKPSHYTKVQSPRKAHAYMDELNQPLLHHCIFLAPITQRGSPPWLWGSVYEEKLLSSTPNSGKRPEY